MSSIPYFPVQGHLLSVMTELDNFEGFAERKVLSVW